MINPEIIEWSIKVLKPKALLIPLPTDGFSALVLAHIYFPASKELPTLHALSMDPYQYEVEDDLCFLKSQIQEGRRVVTFSRSSCVVWYEIQQV